MVIASVVKNDAWPWIAKGYSGVFHFRSPVILSLVVKSHDLNINLKFHFRSSVTHPISHLTHDPNNRLLLVNGLPAIKKSINPMVLIMFNVSPIGDNINCVDWINSTTVGSWNLTIWNSTLFEGRISNSPVFKWWGFSYGYRSCPDFPWILAKWRTFVPILNGWASKFQIPFEIRNICNPTSFRPFKIQTCTDFRSPLYLLIWSLLVELVIFF